MAYRFYSNCESTEAVLRSITDNLITESDEVITSENIAFVNVKTEAESDDDQFAELGADDDDDDDEGDENVEFLDRNYDDDDEDVALDTKLDPRWMTLENILEDYPVEIESFHKVNSNRHRLGTVKSLVTGPTQSSVPQAPMTMIIKPEPSAPLAVKVPKVDKREWVKGGEKPLKICEICGNSYKFAHALASHMRRHRGEKPFECEQCGKAFVIAFELKRHMRTHTGQKPYQCKYCERKFSDFGSRIKHERSHTGERPYVCTTCGKAFAYSHVLTSHTYIHTGEKKYGCDVCGKRFTKSHHLKAHINIHTRAVVRRPVGGAAAKKNNAPSSLNTSDSSGTGMVTIGNYTQLDGSMLNNMEVITIINPSTKAEPNSDDDINGMIIEQHNVGDDISVGGNESMEQMGHIMHVQYQTK